MDTKENIVASRRGFIYTLAGLLSGVLLASPTRLMATKTQAKNLLGCLEIELLEKSRPRKHLLVTWNSCGDTTTLYRERKGRIQPISAMNQVGKTSWEGCDGKNTPRALSKLVQQKYLVSPRQAHVDCFAFLAR